MVAKLKSGAHPNVLVLIADQFRSDAVGANGSPVCRTPRLDALAQDGVTFSRAYCVTPLCTPARAALFTGRYPHSTGLWANTQYPDTPTPRLRDGERMLFEHLAAAGYRCGYVGKWHLSVDDAAEAQRRGIADFLNGAAARRQYYARLGLGPRDDVGGARQRTMAGEHPPMSGVMPYPEDYHGDAAIASETCELLRRYSREGLGSAERPFVLVCSFHGPHFPIEVPEAYAAHYDPAAVPRPPSFDDTFADKPQGQTTHPWLQLASHLSWEQWQRVIAHYWAFCTFIDALLGRVLDTLDEEGLRERTIVLATADHGEMAGHHRLFDKGPYFYEDVMRVPFIWRWPGPIPAHGEPDPSPVSHVDVVPTLLALTGIASLDSTPPLQGWSLAQHLTSPRASLLAEQGRREVFAETTPGDKPNPQVHARAVITSRWKYVYRPDDDVAEELYDLENDPAELHNLAMNGAHQTRMQAMRERLAAWMRATEDPLERPSAMRFTE